MLTKKKVIVSLIVLLFAVTTGSSFVAQKQTARAATQQSTQFEVNVREVLSVSITTPTEWASGQIDDFLRNKINVTVTGNNGSGFVASMSTNSVSTKLTHSENMDVIETLASDSPGYSSFPTNRWGYSLNDTDAGSGSSVYKALVGIDQTPIILISNLDSMTTNSRDIYFGAKADMSKSSGTYEGSIVINVVTGTINDDPSDPDYNPTTPTNPATPASSEQVAEYHSAPTGDPTNGTTTYTYTRTNQSSGTTTTTTQVSDGDNRESYSGYTPPQGVKKIASSTQSVEELSEGPSLAMTLAISSGIAATSGLLFFVLAKSRGDDEEDSGL